MVQSRQESAVLQSLARGVFGRSSNVVVSVTLTADSEFQLWYAGSDTIKQVLPYVTLRWGLWCNTGTMTPYEWYIVHTENATIPDMSDVTVFEGLMREKRIMARGFGMTRKIGVMAPEFHTEKLFNVAIEKGERVYLVFRPMQNSAASDVSYMMTYEQRTISLS